MQKKASTPRPGAISSAPHSKKLRKYFREASAKASAAAGLAPWAPMRPLLFADDALSRTDSGIYIFAARFEKTLFQFGLGLQSMQSILLEAEK